MWQKRLEKDRFPWPKDEGYAGYNFLDGKEDVLHLGCWAHARRMFVKAEKVSKNNAAAKQLLSFIGKIYKEEKVLHT